MDAFSEAVNAGRHTAPLTLTSDEINALFTSDKDLKSLQSRFYVTLENDQLKAQLSVPLEDLGLHIFKGRYLNGSGTFYLSLRNGALYLNARNITVKGKPLPETYMQSIRKQNLARDSNADPQASAAFQRIQSVEITNSELIIRPKENTIPKENPQ